MKAVVYREAGPPEVLSYEEVADPVPQSGEVVIRVEAIAIEGGDVMMRDAWAPPTIPYCPGYSAAGEIIAVGADVHNLRVGQKVTTFAHGGSHAELRLVQADHCWLMPDGMDPVKAACVPVAYGTAYEALFEFGKLKAGQTVLIQAAGGGVSLCGVQLAAKAGARVIGTGSNLEQLDKIRHLGLDEAIDYRSEDITARVLELTDGKGVDVALDPVGGPSLNSVLAATRSGGRVALVGSRGGDPIDPLAIITRELTVHGFLLGWHFNTPRVWTYVADLVRRVAENELEVVVDRTFALSEAIEAHRYAESRGRIGRIIMRP